MSIHDLFLRFHSLFGDMHILEIQSYFSTHLSTFACIFYKMVENTSDNTYHITDIGNVNNITVTYWEYPYNGFDTLKDKNIQNIFHNVIQQTFNIFEELQTGLCNVELLFFW